MIGKKAPRDVIVRRRTHVLTLVAEGYSQKAVATALGVEPSVVMQDVRVLRQRYGAKNIVHLIAIAFRRGILQNNSVAAE